MATKIFIASPCNELSRYSVFWRSLTGLQLPRDVVIAPESEQCRSPYISNNQNILARIFLKTDSDYFWLVNDDQIYPPRILAQLLSHRKDVVVPVCLRHDYPFEPLVYDRLEEDGHSFHYRYLNDDEYGLVPCVASGGGGMLIHRRVFEAIEDPWWETHTVRTPDQPPVQSTEDLDFCKKVFEHGFEMWCDTSSWVGHITLFDVWPFRGQDGKWMTVISRGEHQIIVPAAASPLSIKPLLVKQ
jgi:hypothetical protein